MPQTEKEVASSLQPTPALEARGLFPLSISTSYVSSCTDPSSVLTLAGTKKASEGASFPGRSGRRGYPPYGGHRARGNGQSERPAASGSGRKRHT